MAWVKTDARPATIPADPRDVYGGAGWNGWGDWLGTGNCASTAYTFRPFAEARAYARSLNIATIAAWTLWARSEERPRDIPMQPDNHYRGAGWQGWGDWLGTERIAPYVTPPPRYRPFKNARDFARSLELSTSKAWFAWARTSACPVDIPVYPHLVYRGDGWFGYGDWLGTGIARFTRTYRPFHQARIYARSLGVTSQEAWYTWCKTDVRPSDIPIEPRAMYMGRGWKGWGDWLGTGTKPVYKRVYLSYEQARAYVHHLTLESQRAWFEWAHSSARPTNIPVSPQAVYKGEWQDWGEWLGTNRIAVQKNTYLSFADARSYTRTLGLTSYVAWEAWARTSARPANIPARPSRVYRGKGWVSIADWLGSLPSSADTSNGFLASSSDDDTLFRTVAEVVR